MSYKYRSKRGDIERHQLTVYFPVEWKELLYKYAEKDTRSFNSLMLSITKEFMKKEGLIE
jgi:hypothetical protein